MLGISEWARDVLLSRGALVEMQDGEALRALLPLEVARALGTGEWLSLDFGTSAGPHGSNNRYILRRPYVASPADRMMNSDEICFQCHAWEVYADTSSPETVRSASRSQGRGTDNS